MNAATIALLAMLVAPDGARDDAVRARDVVKRGLVHWDDDVKRRALRVVGPEDLPDVVDSLKRARASKDSRLARCAADALVRCGLENAPAEPELPPEEAALVRARAARDVLTLRRLAASDDDTVSVGAAAALHSFGETPPRPRLLDRLRDPDPPPRAVQAARLVPFAADAPDLRRLLGHRDWFVRAQAARALAVQHDSAAFDAANRFLSDEEAGARSEAIEALADLGDSKAIEPLRAALLDKQMEVRLGAALALHRLGDESGTDTIVGFAVNASEPLRIQACIALGSLDRDIAFPAIRTALRDPNPLVALEAVASLRKVRQSDAARER
ncbi:MAG: HEAT repeat domain-containing protein [Planctomycetes bacterium]|nr:HEAT repeat domain-containing protein [Planctomycetota bacterium]MBI3844277.1 HEAT repeat domain-containing protein [Planctomycetota bacterium]